MKQLTQVLFLMMLPLTLWADPTPFGSNGSTYEIGDGVLTVDLHAYGDLNSLPLDPSAIASCSKLVVIGKLGTSDISHFANYYPYSMNCYDLSQVTVIEDKSPLFQKKPNVYVFPGNLINTTDTAGYYTNEYFVVTGDPVIVKIKDNVSTWTTDPHVLAATNITVYGAKEEDIITMIDKGKTVNGETAVKVEDATEGAVKTAIDAVPLGNTIVCITASGTLGSDDYTAIAGLTELLHVDFSGVTSGLSDMRLPSSVTSATLPGGISYDHGTVTGATAEDIAAIKNIGLAINAFTLSDGTTWNNGTLTISNMNHLADIKTLKDAGYNITTIHFPNGTVYGNGTLRVTAADETNLATFKTELDEANCDINKVVLSDGTIWNNGTMVSSATDAAAARKKVLESGGFTVSTTAPLANADNGITVTYDNGVVHINSTAAGALATLLTTDYSSDPESAEYKEQQQALEYIKSATDIVLEGPFQAGDAENTNDLKNLANTNKNVVMVDMRKATFTNDGDAKFTYWDQGDNTTLREAYISEDETLTTISATMFQNMKNYESIHIPSQVTVIDQDAFNGANTLKHVDWGEDCHVQTIGSRAFDGADLTGELVIPNSVRTIMDEAFKANLNITSIIIQKESQLDSIAYQAFYMDPNHPDDIKLKNVYVYKDAEIKCHKDAWDFYCTDGQTKMSTVKTRLIYPIDHYAYYVGDWKAQVKGGKVVGHDDLLQLRKAVDGESVSDENNNPVTVTPRIGIGWQKFISTGIPVTNEFDWRTYSDLVPLKVPAAANKVADVYIVCGYNGNEAVLKQMKEGDVIPAGTGIVIHHTIIDENGGLLSFERATGEGDATAKPYEYFIEGDKRAIKEGRKTRLYQPTGESLPSEYSEGYPNYLEAIYTQGKERAIYNAENGNYTEQGLTDKTYEMAAYSGQRVTYRNFFFGNGQKLAASQAAGNNVVTDNWTEADSEMGWSFFRAKTDYYNVNSKAFLHLPASVYNDPQGGALGTVISSGSRLMAKGMGLFILDNPPSEDTTGIHNMNVNDDVNNLQDKKGWFTLQGVRVERPSENGIYIHNGKKVVVK